MRTYGFIAEFIMIFSMSIWGISKLFKYFCHLILSKNQRTCVQEWKGDLKSIHRYSHKLPGCSNQRQRESTVHTMKTISSLNPVTYRQLLKFNKIRLFWSLWAPYPINCSQRLSKRKMRVLTQSGQWPHFSQIQSRTWCCISNWVPVQLFQCSV